MKEKKQVLSLYYFICIKIQLVCSQSNYQGRVVDNNQASVIHATNNLAGLTTVNWTNNLAIIITQTV